jgi:multidrug efflux pump
MGLSALCINRPVFASVLSLLVLLVGLVAYQRLPVREYPNIDEPVVTVSIDYRGAAAAIMESEITQPLEESISGIEGIKTMSSISRDGRSQITVRFDLRVDPDAAASDVRDRVGRVRGRLPDEVDEPVIAKVEADAQPIIYIAMNSDRLSPMEVTDIADRVVKTRLQTITGVSEVRLFGARAYSMRIWLDRARLAAYQLTAQDVENALRKQNVNIPAGRIESMAREFTVKAETNLLAAEQFDRIVLKDADGYLVRLADVAKTELGPQDDRVIARFNGKPSITLGIVKQATANPLEVSQGVRTALPDVKANLPEGMDIDIGFDTSVFIDRSITSVYETIGEAVLLVVLVIFVFLRSVRATLIPIVTIPVSLIGACFFMYALGFSMNTITLLAFVLAVGLVVDDAIVVLENIYRNIESGLEPKAAALKGMREISFAVVAMTLTLVAVYIPVAFATGRVGKLFTEFAITLAGAVLVSGFVALTLTPMLSSRILRGHQAHGALYRMVERALDALTSFYAWSLRQALRIWPAVILLAVVVAGANYLLFRSLPSELAPVEDRGTILSVAVAPEGATAEYTSTWARRIEQILSTVPEARAYVTVVGFPDVNNMVAWAPLVPWEKRNVTQQQLIARIIPQYMQIPGVMAFPINVPSLGQGFREKPVQFVVQTTGTYAELDEIMHRMLARASALPSLINVESDLKMNKPQIGVEVNRDKVADVGVDVDALGRTLETLLGGRQVTRFERDGKQYDVIVRMAGVDRRNPDDLASIYVRAQNGAMVQLSNLVSLQERVSPRELNRFNQARAATLTANLAPGHSLGEALAQLEAIARQELPPTARVDYSGESREFRESSASLYVTFLLALGFIYLVLSAQFESFVDPFIIMGSVPLSIAGALAALHLSGSTLNIYSQIGLITLIGLITKHGILIVEFANQLQDQGLSRIDAVVQAATLRLRPILMTTGAMVLGAVPLALAQGAGAESRHAIGWVIVGGLLVGTVLTLLVVPVAYRLLARNRSRVPATAVPRPAE